MDYAIERPEDEYSEMLARQPWRPHPKPVPLVMPRTKDNPNLPVSACNHKGCTTRNQQGYFEGGQRIRHGDYCNGEHPRWQCRLILRLLSPGLLMKEIAQECRSVILASGSLAPLPSLCAELNLYPPKESAAKTPLSQPGVHGQKASASLGVTKVERKLASPKPLKHLTPNPAASPFVNLTQSSTPAVAKGLSQSPSVATTSQKEDKASKELHGRLQVTPKPLEANHVVSLQKQVYAAAIGHFPDGSPMTVRYANYKDPTFVPRLGNAIATVIESIPFGGVLVFFPSYTFMNKCVKCWNPKIAEMAYNTHACPQIWSRFVRSKGCVIVEPTGSQTKFEEARDEYSRNIKENRKCILLAVFRGKMSEGISFNDNHARCVICVGVPYPNSFDRNIKAKMLYNDEQRKIRKNTHLLPGQEWYSQQAYRAIAQALGRCIRHGADYGSVILMDLRHCDDGSPNDGLSRAQKNLPKWMRHHLRTLSMRPTNGIGQNPILGGYHGIQRELSAFFQQAPIHSKSVLDKWKSELAGAQARSRQFQNHTFDRETGKWTTGEEKPKSESGRVKRET
jgi:hypothetical protein